MTPGDRAGRPPDASSRVPGDARPAPAANGSVVAALLAAGVGSFAMGLFVILHEAELFSATALYRPSGGVSGRTTFAAVAWLLAWGFLHARWRGRRVDARLALAATLALVALGLLLTFPPVWQLVHRS